MINNRICVNEASKCKYLIIFCLAANVSSKNFNSRTKLVICLVTLPSSGEHYQLQPDFIDWVLRFLRLKNLRLNSDRSTIWPLDGANCSSKELQINQLWTLKKERKKWRNGKEHDVSRCLTPSLCACVCLNVCVWACAGRGQHDTPSDMIDLSLNMAYFFSFYTFFIYPCRLSWISFLQILEVK